MKTMIISLLAMIVTAMEPIRASDFVTALAAGQISATFRGIGGSSGDSIEVVVAKTARIGPELELTMTPGTRLQNASSSAQNMVIAGVQGERMGASSYSPGPVIRVQDTPTTYILEAYCTDFEKANPAPQSQFQLGKADPVLACILSKAAGVSPEAKQAAVWIYTDKATYGLVNAKFPLSTNDWNGAVAVVKKCLNDSQISSRPTGL
jgi:hypothetical protein